MAKSKKLTQGLHHLEEFVLAGLLFLMTALTFSQVVARYVFNSGWIASLEVTTTFFKILVLLGVSWGVREKALLGIDLILGMFSKEVKRLVSLFAVATCITYTVMLLYGSVIYESRLFSLGIEMIDLAIPRWVPTFFLPFGLGLILLRLIILGVKIFQGKESQIVQSESEMSLQESGKIEEDAKRNS